MHTLASTPAYLYPTGQTLILEIEGSDASQVVNNLTTNDVVKLPCDAAQETFVTDLRGWTVAHGCLLKQEKRLWLVGSHPDPSRVVSHIDRYIIREAARVIDHSQALGLLWTERPLDTSDEGVLPFHIPTPAVMQHLMLGPREFLESLLPSTKRLSEDAWELLRIRSFWPFMGLEISEKCIPQEVDRSDAAISFTKGCYLGQETIARLDARGQLQKKLCLIQFDGPVNTPGPVQSDGKEIGQLTSIASDPATSNTFALGFIKRGYFEPQQTVACGGVSGVILHPGFFR